MTAPPVHGLEASVFREVPLEIFLRITDFLPTPDLGAFRLSCRAVHGLLDNTFIKEFFTRKQFMLTIFSLNALVEISQSRLGAHLRFLHIGLERPELRPFDLAHREAHTPSSERQRRLGALVAEERVAAANGHHRDMLITALKNLPNLEAILIRDHNSKRRTRDGWNAEWRSYGHKTLVDSTSGRPTYPTYPVHPMRQIQEGNFGGDASDVFSQVLYACAHSGSRPLSIEVITQRIPVRGSAFALPPSMGRADVTSVVEGLQKLHLNFMPTWRGDRGPKASDIEISQSQVSDSTNPHGIQDADYSLYSFLCRAKNLTDLRINQPPTRVEQDNNPAHYLLEFAASAVAAAPPGEPFLPKLQHLSIGRSHLKAEVLARLIRAFARQLKSLELWRINLYRPLPQLTHGETWPKVKFWPSFLRDLRGIPDLDLRHVKFGLMSQSHLSAEDHAHLGPLCMVGIAGMGNIDYTGADWRKYLEDKEGEMEVMWETPYEHGDEDGSDEDSLDEDSDSGMDE